MIRLNAMLGLAAVHETRHAWDDARALYDQIVEAAGDEYASIAATAKGRAAALDRATVPVRFAPEPPPVEAADPMSDVPMIPAAPLAGDADVPAAAETPAAETPATDSGDGG
jgi:hypothetical protein